MLRTSTAPLLALCALAGCSPALDWRSVAPDGAGLSMMLPCKPDQATRPVDLGGRTVDLAMAGCKADGATFAMSHMRLDDPSQAGAVLGQWRAAVRARMQADAGPSTAAGVPDASFVPAGALNLPQSVRSVAQGRGPDGAAVTAQAVWFARLEGAQAHLYHAVVYTPEPRPQVADTFFAGLVLR